ncbi:MAG: molybdopterin-dependent oxidoreductase, partial [Deltaproteobacteria bacterium]|nr:molybdopterin-dependent oxidoreductase [Deltaproteobacteria bacterium]
MSETQDDNSVLNILNKGSNKDGIARRDFLTIMGASMALAGISCVRRPVHKIIPYVIQPEEIIPGVANWYASTHPATGVGILIKTREGRPVKLEGNSLHPLSLGALSANIQASVLDLYDPDRLKTPLIINSKTREKEITSWDTIDALVTEKLKIQKPDRIRILSQTLSGDTTTRLVHEFLNTFRCNENSHVQYHPLYPEEIVQAQELSYGTRIFPKYDFSKAELVISLGADFLATWGYSLEQANAWSQRRKLNSNNHTHATLSKLICFESHFSLTGANADERFCIRPGDELKIALALAYEIVFNFSQKYLHDQTVISALQAYMPELVTQQTGLPLGEIKKLAKLLWNLRGQSLIVGGGIASKTSSDLALQIAINFLNSVLENESVTVDGTMNPKLVLDHGYSQFYKLISDIKSGKVDLLILAHANILYQLPALELEQILKQVPTVISVTDREDETSRVADFILPDHHYLENWGDHHPTQEIYSLQQPAIAPLHTTRSFQDSLLVWTKKAGLRAHGLLARQLPSWYEYLKTNWQENIYKTHHIAGSFDLFWENILKDGYYRVHSKHAITPRVFQTSSLDHIRVTQPINEGNIQLVLYAKLAMGDGSQANNAWLQEMPDPISTVTWDNYLNISPVLAKNLQIGKNDVVELKQGTHAVHVPVIIQAGMHPSVVSLAVGYGRTAVGKVGNNVGVNAFSFVQAPVEVRKTGKFYKLAETQWHHVTENRPIINDISLNEFRKNASASNHTNPHLRMEKVQTIWPEHEYKGSRWAMAIDLNSCIGCGACVIGCQAENNIPVVGRDNVRVSREMHWIRIDRYYSGDQNNPDVIFQPMLCQH